MTILKSSLALIRQQIKSDWIKYGGDCTKFFFARMKQRRLATYIYTIKDIDGTQVEGLCDLMDITISSSKTIGRGCSSMLTSSCLNVTGFQIGSLPLKCLGIPITASIFSKLKCGSLVDKILAKAKIWSSKSISFARRTALINLVLFGLYNFGVSIVIILQGVTDQINRACKNQGYAELMQLLGRSLIFRGKKHTQPMEEEGLD
ncbi:hypothetical protein Cgig2_013737 [Carnegiea gigantea]|uniref:Uncharacterized protein n=1 Tax=Carnegiea gigantea TaxID=171969 RepID=A0A9Q1Q8Q8_9CARY|nr:hypothetical protein Cgig2_013737 [Carnegiea gigantea]